MEHSGKNESSNCKEMTRVPTIQNSKQNVYFNELAFTQNIAEACVIEDSFMIK